MAFKRSKTLAAVAIALAAAWGQSASAALIDDFNDASLAEYTKSVVLEQSGVNAVSFASPSGKAQVSKAADTATAEQVVFLRGDFSLSIGDVLRIDTTAQTAAGYADFGIAVASTADPADAVWTSGTADARSGYAAVYLKGQTSNVGYYAAQIGGGQIVSSSGALVVGDTYLNISGLFIRRNSSTSFDLGYTIGGVDKVRTTANFTGTTVGTAVGLYADLRATGTFGDLDNLRTAAIPEPSTAVMALASLALVAVRRRR